MHAFRGQFVMHASGPFIQLVKMWRSKKRMDVKDYFGIELKQWLCRVA